jgi:pyruvate dehydrogenase E2 component (dihydrolipoamide acetyltransferase)
VEVGTPIAVLGSAGEDISAFLDDAAPTAAPMPKGAPARVFASPLARKLLKEAGVAPRDVTGTGPNGRIIRKDAEAAITKSRVTTTPAPPPPAPPVPTGFSEVPHSRIRHVIATRLTASKQTIPHFYLRRTARIDELLALRKHLNEVAPTKVSVNDLIIKAVAIAHQAVPEANVIWTDDAMRHYESVDIAVAIASERGLVTPVLRAVETASLSAISAKVKAFAQAASDGKLMQRDLEGGTITVSNLGMYGVDEFAAIINPPQSAILAVGAGKPSPAVVDGELSVATQLTMVLSVDHRAIDGALAAQWMAALVAAIEQPLRLLA